MKEDKEMMRSVGHRRKGGTHGSLSKAGRIRDTSNPINWRIVDKGVDGKKMFRGKLMKNRKTPRTNNRRKYNERHMGREPKPAYDRRHR